MRLFISLTIFFLTLFSTLPAFSKVITQFVPFLTITEEYTDNYNQTKNNKADEFSTIYGAELSFGVIDQNGSMFLNYTPEYTDHADHNENDSWRHAISLEGQIQTSKHTIVTFSETYVRDLNRTVTTNTWEKHDTNNTSAGVLYAFGTRDSFGLNYTYSFDDYENPSADAYKSHNPSASFSYWVTPVLGLDLTAAYEKIEYDISTDEPETWSGHIRFLKSMTRHFDAYVSYAHTDTDQESGDHIIYHPSIGFDWRPTEDSGVSMGVGVLFQEWDNQNSTDSQDIFLDLNAYKTFDFSRKGTFSITGSSGYAPIGEDAASLGFNIYYETGFLLSYRLTRRLTGELNGSYQIDQYDTPGIDRTDNTLGIGAGLVWSPLQWLTLNLSYLFTDFNTDATAIEDYQENVGMFTIRMTPERPIRYQSSTPRATLENRLFE
jgi:opacity protein-like surface antigen